MRRYHSPNNKAGFFTNFRITPDLLFTQEKSTMNVLSTRLRGGAVAALSLGLLLCRALPASAQFYPARGWGQNNAGQIGEGSPYGNDSEPQQVLAGPTVLEISTGGYHTLALLGDGKIWTWGDNSAGELGNSTPYSTGVPAPMQNFSNIRHVAAGGDFSLAVKNDGSVWAWGSNYSGSLGHGGFDNAVHSAPTVVNSLFQITAVSAGSGHGMALEYDGYVYTWGFNLDGQLGTGDTTNYAYPGMVQGLNNVRQIAAGQYHSMALKNDGTVWMWGDNSAGQLGDGTKTNRYTPTQVVGLNNVVAIATNSNFSAALKNDGTVWMWGAFYSYNYTTTPSKITELGFNNAQIAVGQAHILALDNQGYLWTMGDNEYGQTGDPRAGTYQYPPRKLDKLYNVTAITASYGVSFAITNSAHLSGNIRLDSISPSSSNKYDAHQSVTMIFRSPGQPDITRYVGPGYAPFVQVDDLPRGAYTVYIKGNKWLQRIVNVDLSYYDATSLDVTLPAGDANNDNSVDSTDFGILIGAFNTSYSIPGSGYDYTADFNCDGSVDSTDFGILIGNFNMVGDN